MVEIQGTAEGEPFSEAQFSTLLRPGPARHRRAVRRSSARPWSADAAPARKPAAGWSSPATMPASCGRSRRCSRPSAMEVVSAGELGLPEPAETEDELPRQRPIKALAAARAAGLPALADDCGFSSPRSAATRACAPPTGRRCRAAAATMRWPWPRCAALAAPHARTARPGSPAPLVLAWPDGHTEGFEGKVHGAGSPRRAATQGFGYDPMFLPDGGAETFGEMDPAEKHASATAPAPSPCWPRPACPRRVEPAWPGAPLRPCALTRRALCRAANADLRAFRRSTQRRASAFLRSALAGRRMRAQPMRHQPGPALLRLVHQAEQLQVGGIDHAVPRPAPSKFDHLAPVGPAEQHDRRSAAPCGSAAGSAARTARPACRSRRGTPPAHWRASPGASCAWRSSGSGRSAPGWSRGSGSCSCGRVMLKPMRGRADLGRAAVGRLHDARAAAGGDDVVAQPSTGASAPPRCETMRAKPRALAYQGARCGRAGRRGGELAGLSGEGCGRCRRRPRSSARPTGAARAPPSRTPAAKRTPRISSRSRKSVSSTGSR